MLIRDSKNTYFEDCGATASETPNESKQQTPQNCVDGRCVKCFIIK